MGSPLALSEGENLAVILSDNICFPTMPGAPDTVRDSVRDRLDLI